MVHVGDPVGEPHHLRLEGGGHGHGPRVVDDPVADLPREVQAGAVLLQVVDDPEALLVVPERTTEERGEGLLAEVAEGGVTEVVAEGDGLGEVLVQAQDPGRRPRDLRDLEGVGEPDAVVVTLGRDEHLGLVLQPAESLGVHDAVAIALERRPERVRGLVAFAALALGGQDRALGQRPALDLLEPIPRCGAHRLLGGHASTR